MPSKINRSQLWTNRNLRTVDFGGHVEGEGSWGILFGRCEQTRFDWLQGVPWYMITCKEHGTWFYNQGGCESGGRWQKWVQSKHCIYKNSLYNKMRGWIFCRIYVLWNKTINKYIYICKRKIRNWGNLEFERLRNLDVCEGAPLRPCSIFLTMKGLIKILFGAGNGASLPCNQIPACAALLPPGKGSIQYITKKSSPSIS